MKFTPAQKGLAVAFLLLLTLSFLWSLYDERLQAQKAPPENYKLLEKFENEGVPVFEAVRLPQGDVFRFNDSFKKISAKEPRLVVLSFWATWCAPCIEEFPSLINMLNTFEGEVVLVAISADQRREDVMDFVKMFKAESNPYFINLWDPSLKIASDYGTEKIPENYIIGTDLKLIRKFSSTEKWDSPEMLAYMETLIRRL